MFWNISRPMQLSRRRLQMQKARSISTIVVAFTVCILSAVGMNATRSVMAEAVCTQKSNSDGRVVTVYSADSRSFSITINNPGAYASTGTSWTWQAFDSYGAPVIGNQFIVPSIAPGGSFSQTFPILGNDVNWATSSTSGTITAGGDTFGGWAQSGCI
jgi:hypothetical protein